MLRWGCVRLAGKHVETANDTDVLRRTRTHLPQVDRRRDKQRARVNEPETQPHQRKPTAAPTPSFEALSLSVGSAVLLSLS